MRYPNFLPENGRIGFIAPSFGCFEEPYRSCFDEALRRFKALGYECVEGPNCRAGIGIGKSNTPEACGAEINDFFLNDRSDVIIACGGGESMCEDLPFVDFAAIAEAKPKWYMGYSDNTNLVLLLPTLCDTAAIYGPHASSFGQKPWHESTEDALALLKGEKLSFTNYPRWEKESLKSESNPFASYNTTEPFDMKLLGADSDSARFSGRLLGGCLDVMSLLCGTRFDAVREFNERYKDDGVVWFIEACELGAMSIRRVLWQLKNAGWFDEARGFIFGRPYMFDTLEFGLDRVSAVYGILEDLHVPVLIDADVGHLPPAVPLMAGAMADISAGDGSFFIRMMLE
ncbi:MAG TPA: LD-carboxypeptidase [Bacillota bacterium]|nr:LD-carboxypeptidase [Bacillota bacterium]